MADKKLLNEDALIAVKNYVDTTVQTAISTAYKIKGTKTTAEVDTILNTAIASGTVAEKEQNLKDMIGDVYNISNAGQVNLGAVVYNGTVALIQESGSTAKLDVNEGDNIVMISETGTYSGQTATFYKWDKLAGFIDLSGYVPYSGASTNLNLGNHDLIAENSYSGVTNYTNVSPLGIEINAGLASDYGSAACINIHDPYGIVPQKYFKVENSSAYLAILNYSGSIALGYNYHYSSGGSTVYHGGTYQFPSGYGTIALENWVTSQLSSYVTLSTSQDIIGEKTFYSVVHIYASGDNEAILEIGQNYIPGNLKIWDGQDGAYINLKAGSSGFNSQTLYIPNESTGRTLATREWTASNFLPYNSNIDLGNYGLVTSAYLGVGDFTIKETSSGVYTLGLDTQGDIVLGGNAGGVYYGSQSSSNELATRGNLSAFVPYSGATSNVTLGNHILSFGQSSSFNSSVTNTYSYTELFSGLLQMMDYEYHSSTHSASIIGYMTLLPSRLTINAYNEWSGTGIFLSCSSGGTIHFSMGVNGYSSAYFVDFNTYSGFNLAYGAEGSTKYYYLPFHSEYGQGTFALEEWVISKTAQLTLAQCSQMLASGSYSA